MGFASDIANQIGQTADAAGQNSVPGNVVGNMGQPTGSGMGGAASPIPGNTIGVNPMGGTGGGYNTGAPGMGNNGGGFGKFGDIGGQPGNIGGGFGKFGGIDPIPQGGGNMNPSQTQNPLIGKGVMPPPMSIYNTAPPMGTMPPGQVNQATPAQVPINRPTLAPAPRRGVQPLRPVKGVMPQRGRGIF